MMTDAPEGAEDQPVPSVEANQTEQDGGNNDEANGDRPSPQPKLRNIYEDDLEGQTYRYISEVPKRETNRNQYANLIKHQFRPDEKNLEHYKFNMIIVDEAQKLKNADSDISRAMNLFKTDSIVYTTSTPLYSALSDILSPLKLIWNLLGIKCTFPTTLGEYVGLYDPNYDPVHGLVAGDSGEIRTQGLFPLLDAGSDDDRHACAVFRQAWEEHRLRLWQLSPRLLRHTGERFKWNVEFGRSIVLPLLRLVGIFFSRSSKIELPNGTVQFPGVGIPPIMTITEELCHGPAEHERVRKTCKKLADELARMTEYHRLADVQRLMPDQGRIDFGKEREAIFYSFDSRFITLFTNEYVIRARDRDRWRDAWIATIVQRMTETNATGTAAARAALTGHDLPAIVGRERVEDLIKHDFIGGLLFWFDNTKECDNMVCPATRHEMVRWCLQTNPIMTRVLHHVVELVQEGRQRVVIYTKYPMLQQ